MRILKSTVCTVAILSIYATSAYAGVYTDDLSKCLVDSSSTRDRTVLVTWMFSALSVHPAVKSIVSVSEKQLDEANKSAADLVTKLLVESCKQETEKALQYEGDATIQESFRVLGEVAARELFPSPEVATALSGFEKYLDEEQFKSLLEIKRSQ